MTDLVRIAVPSTDQEIIATVDGMVSLRHACEAIGLSFDAQRVKLNRKVWATVTLSVTVGSDGKPREMVLVDRRTFTMWLATIDTSRVSPEARPMVEAFQAEAADALDAYFNEGGAINPRASDDQLDIITRQASVLKALRGVVDPNHLEAKGRLILARALGEAPELDQSTVPLYVSDYLKSKRLNSTQVAAKASGFGKRLKALYIKRHDREPNMHHQELPNGTVRQVCAYTEADRPLFDAVWARDYSNVVVLPGGSA